MKYCTQCGAEQDDQAIYCSSCGEKFVSKDYMINHKTSKKNGHKNLRWIGIGLGITLIVCTVLFILISDKQQGHPVTLSKESARELIETEFLVLMNYEENSNPLVQVICKSFHVEIERINTNEDDTKIICIVSNHSVKEAMLQIERTFDKHSSDSFQSILDKCFEESSVMQTRLEITCINLEQGCKVQLSEQDLDACTGGLLSYYSELMVE